MSSVLIALTVVPLASALAAWLVPAKMGAVLTVLGGTATFGLCLALVPHVAGGRNGTPVEALGHWLRVDPLSLVFQVATAFLYALTAVFAVGYVRADRSAGPAYARHLYAGLNLFAWAMAMAPMIDNFGLIWVAVEVTTVVSALLVALEGTVSAIEAAWKYILVASLGLGLSLLATAVMYHAGSYSLGHGYDLSYSELLGRPRRFPAGTVRLAYVLAVLGFGTKVGLFPVHTWLPDAHSEAPTPVSALLSGALLATCFYAILRYYQVTERAGDVGFARGVLAGFGVATLLLGALYLGAQRDLKRLLAYSSIEHMGILAIGVSFASPLAIAGALLHVLAHAAAKGTSFFGAGSIVRKLHTKDLQRVRGGVGLLPWSGPLLIAGMLGLSAMPPFGTFRSELSIVAGGLSGGTHANSVEEALAAVLVVLATLAFCGLSWHISQSLLTPDPKPSADAGPVTARGETSRLIVAAMVLGLAGLLVLGVHPPAQLVALLNKAAAELGGAP